MEFTPLHVVSKRTTDNSLIEIKYLVCTSNGMFLGWWLMLKPVEAKRSTKIISRNPYKVANNFTSKKSYILNERGASCPSSILRHRLVRWADAVRRTDTVLPRGKKASVGCCLTHGGHVEELAVLRINAECRNATWSWGYSNQKSGSAH